MLVALLRCFLIIITIETIITVAINRIATNEENCETGGAKAVGLKVVVIGKGAGADVPIDHNELTRRSIVMVEIDRVLPSTFFILPLPIHFFYCKTIKTLLQTEIIPNMGI